MTRLALIRHGLTDWNESKRIQGRCDRPLSDAGVAAVARWRLPDELQGFEWVASPLFRARETARILLGAEVPVEPALTEMTWGAWEGRRLADLNAELGSAFAEAEANGLDFRAPNGESPRDVQVRLSPWLSRIAGEVRPVGAVTHKGVIRAILALATDWDYLGKPPVRLDWNSVHVFRVDRRGRPDIERLNIALAPT
ncbi:MAG TPA: histidine phosphatase family protein [Alphaproteobacteria bacterium]|nr:histidine phosphatase family protein [Alphaproteobacteria bacterium]